MTNRERINAMTNRELVDFILRPMAHTAGRSIWNLCAECPDKMRCTGEKPCPGAFAAWLEAEEEQGRTAGRAMTNYDSIMSKNFVALSQTIANICMMCDECGYRLADGNCGAGWSDCAAKWERWLTKEEAEA